MNIQKYLLPLAVALLLTGCNNSTSDTSSNGGTNNPNTPTTPPDTIAPDKDPSTSEPTDPSPTQPNPTTPPVTQTYEVVVDTSYPPFAFNDDSGNIAGFDIDILQAAGEQAGFAVDFTPAYWDEIFTTLEAGESDMAASGIVVSDELTSKVDFSTPYLDVNQIVVYNADSPKTFEQLASGTFGIQSGASIQATLNNLNIDTAQIFEYPTSFDAFNDLLANEIDAIVEDRTLFHYQLHSRSGDALTSNLKTIDLPDAQSGERAFAINKGNSELLERVNKGLADIKQNGEYNNIYEKWFGQSAAQ